MKQKMCYKPMVPLMFASKSMQKMYDQEKPKQPEKQAQAPKMCYTPMVPLNFVSNKERRSFQRLYNQPNKYE